MGGNGVLRGVGRPAAAIGLAVWLLLALSACEAPASPSASPAAPGSRGDALARGGVGGTLLTEITAEVGLPEAAPPWPDGTYFLPEVTAPGAGLFDYDGDGDLDLVSPRVPEPGSSVPASSRLYQRQPDGRFLDVSERSGLINRAFGHGVAIGDVEGDGDLDVYFTNYGGDAFFRNQGDGTFREATSEAGFSGDAWSTSAAFCDYDRDGDLDLYVAHYLQYDHRSRCTRPSSVQDYCGPETFFGTHDSLYRNDGSGRFAEVGEQAGVRVGQGGRTAKGLGVVCADLTRDGWPDFFVANDGEANHLWVNGGDGTFDEQAMGRGTAVSRHGAPEANMGIALGDVDGEGTLDLYVTHLFGENNALYTGGPGALFTDRTVESRLALHDLALTGFGAGFFDLENDGDLDLAVANGRVYRGEILPGAALGRFWNAYAEPNLLFINEGGGFFSSAGPRAGPFTSRPEVGRGLAFGDLDADGDLDLVLSTVDNHLRVFRNDAPPAGHHWLAVRAITGKRDAYGAEVTIEAGGRRQIRLVQPAYSYLNSSDPRAHFGLGPTATVDSIEVLWPDGKRERSTADGVDRQLTLHQGRGSAP